jgi:hypothetical protein
MSGRRSTLGVRRLIKPGGELVLRRRPKFAVRPARRQQTRYDLRVDRRWVGFFIMFAVLVTAIVMPNLGPQRVAGSPVAAPIPGPPGVGDCLLDPTIASWLYNRDPIYAARRLEPCAGPRYGEVIAVINDSRSPERIAAATLTTTHPMGQSPSDDPTLQSCDAALNPYLGLPPGSGTDGVDAVDGWSYTGLAIPAPVGPDNRQQAAGQHWVACVMIGLDPDRQTGNASVYVQKYAASAHRVYSTGRPPSAFALCVPKMILPQILHPAGCSRPHAVEVFGVTETHSKHVTQAQLNASCRKLVRRLTRMPDVTAGGRLAVAADSLHLDPYGGGQLGFSTAESESGFSICLATTPATHLLKGALLGLGTGPVPWA